MNNLFLGVDTSNYTTSLCLYDGDKIIADVRRLLPVKEGQRGLRQSDAVFFHTKALPELSEELFSNAGYSPERLRAVGASQTPRDAEGSYMPCFLTGMSFASGIAHALKLPMYGFSHQAGPISAAVSSCGKPETFLDGDFFAFHVSGGTTEALICRYDGKTFDCHAVGGTSDASAGQMIDRAGVMAGLKFPCGKELDGLSLKSAKKLPLCVSVKDAYFSMSGLENKTAEYLNNGEDIADVARFLFLSIARAVSECVRALRQKYGYKPVLFAGGVMSNTLIRRELSELDGAYFASPRLSCDNACGTAILAYKRHKSILEGT